MAFVTQPGQIDKKPRVSAPTFWGLVLVAVGVVLQALALGLVPSPSGEAVGVTLAVIGLAVLASHAVLRAHWWTLIAGPTLLAIGAVILLPGGGSGAIFLGGIGVGFGLVALTSARRWWAIIPAGTMLSLALVALLSTAIGGLMSGAVLFFGLAMTFGIMSLVRVDGRAMSWPLYPALGLMLFAMALAMSGSMSSAVWPLMLVAVGVFLLIRARARRT